MRAPILTGVPVRQAPGAAVAGSGNAQVDGGTQAPSSSDGWAIVGQLATAVGAGIGVISFIVAFGGAVIWARARSLGLPGNEIVAVVPKEVLLSSGAAFLVPAVGLALLVPAILFMVDFLVGYSAAQSARELDERAADLRSRAEAARAQAADAEEQARTRIVGEAEALSARRPAPVEWLQDAASRLDGLSASVLAAHERAARLTEEAGAASEDAAAAAHELEHLTFQQRTLRRAIGVLTLMAIQVGAAVVVADGLSLKQLIGLVLMALFTSALSMVVYERYDKTAWFLLAAFVSAGVFIGLVTYDRTVTTPKVEPAAAMRADRTVLAGFYIARTADSLYLATIPRPRQPARLVRYPAKDLTSVAIGSLLTPKIAGTRARAIAAQLCAQADAAAKRAATKDKPAGPACVVVG